MNESILKGHWRIKELSAKPLFGEIRYINTVFELTINFEINEHHELDKIDKVFEKDIIRGKSLDGFPVTICNLRYRGFIATGNFSYEIKFYLDFFIKGHHFRSIKSIKYDYVKVELTQLQNWVCYNGFIVDHPEDTKIAYKLEFKKSEEIEIILNNRDKISFSTRCNYPKHTEPYPIKKQILTQSTALKIILKTNNIENYFEYIEAIKAFISFAMNEPVLVTSIIGINKDSKNFLPNFEPQRIYKNGVFELDLDSKFKNPKRNSLFLFPDIREYSESLFVNWFKSYFEMKNAISLYIKSLETPENQINDKLIFLLLSLESILDVEIDSTFVDKRVCEKKIFPIFSNCIPRLPNCVSEETKLEFSNSINNQLKNLNNYSFKKKLRILISSQENVLEEFSAYLKYYLDKIIFFRNKYVHPSHNKEISLNNDIIFNLYRFTNLIFSSYFLKKIGLPDKEIKRILSDTISYRFTLFVFEKIAK